uniref:BACK domain-containing protein n=1 Tax=Tetradesmus obliquus TaxID=3088 RepID=A0A383W8I4_TETOB|eukprot:jgi/Sobl393_1/11698/SZX73553.1
MSADADQRRTAQSVLFATVNSRASKVSQQHGSTRLHSFCNTKLQSWSSSSSNGKLEICITTPPGQVEAGELLMQCMYAAQPDLSTCSQEQLLQLLLLADSYGVPKVIGAAAAAFDSIVSADLQWETVQARYALPPGCAELDACKPLFEAAGEKLQDELGDLELAWADASKQQLLLGLPQPALLQLLQDDNTCVASENTVFFTISQWCRQQQQPAQQQQQQQQQEAVAMSAKHDLLKLVRMQHCTGLYATAVVARTRLAQSLFSAAEIAEACVLASAGKRSQVAQTLLEHSPAVARFPAWKAAKRPASAMRQLDMQWQLPLQQLQEAVQQHLQHKLKMHYLLSTRHTWQGTCFMLKVEVTTDTAAPRTQLGLYIRMLDVPSGGVRSATYKLSIAAAPGSQAGNTKPDIELGPLTYTWTNEKGRGNNKLVTFDALSNWQQAEAKLRQLGLVHSDGCLHLRGLVTNIE